ncbi:MAG: peroxiredoxin [Finegoldia magna]|nr:peroxiredoxin [Finegoldia magna]MDU5442936.1 peroxiredoxin [Finegoldia magna]
MNNLKEFLNEEYYEKYKGKNLVVYIYPKDNTSGCTIEADGFSEVYDEFQKLNTEVVGISKDSEKTHENFRKKQGLKQELISDPERIFLNNFGCVYKGKMYGKEVTKTERSTFVFDKDMNLVKEFRKVKPDENPQEVLDFVRDNLND